MIFKNIRKCGKLAFFKTKNHIKTVISKNSSIWCFFKSARQVCNLLYFNLIKTEIKTLIFFKKVDFYIFEPKNREVIENSSKALLLSIEMHIFGQKIISISLAFSQKNEIEKWPLRTSVQFIYYAINSMRRVKMEKNHESLNY